jgi:hypothetical protein
MCASGQVIYFKRDEDKKLRKGTILDVTPDGYQVQARRSADKITPPVYLIPAHQIVSDHVPVRERKSTIHETVSTHGRQITATEMNRRADVATERFQMTEAQVLQAKAMLEIRKRILAKAAYRGGIQRTTNDQDYLEICSEYDLASIQAFRTSSSKATVADIQLFRNFIDGATDTVGTIALTIFRSAKTAAIRFLKARSAYHLHHEDISDHAWRLAA